MVQYACYSSPFGPIRIGCTADAVVEIRRTGDPGADAQPTPLSDLAARQLTEYFQGTRRSFDFPMEPKGTPFQTAVWKALLEIPYGQTRSYQDIAAAIGNPTACRAVGRACNRNPIWIAIPCHRILGKNRQLTGYAGGLDMKQQLLQLERSNT